MSARGAVMSGGGQGRSSRQAMLLFRITEALPRRQWVISADGSRRWDCALFRDRSDRSPLPRAVAAAGADRERNGGGADPFDDRLGSSPAYHHGPDSHLGRDSTREG